MVITAYSDRVHLWNDRYFLFINSIENHDNFTLLFNSILAYDNIVSVYMLYFRRILKFFNELKK